MDKNVVQSSHSNDGLHRDTEQTLDDEGTFGQQNDDDNEDDDDDEEMENRPLRRTRNILAGAVSHVVNPVIECVDIEGVSRRIDVAELSRRVDVADISRRLDVSHMVRRINIMDDVVDRIDWNEILLERIDLDRVVDRIDVERVVQRSNLHAIVAQSTSSIITNMLDILRAQVIRFDLVVHDVFRPCRWPRRQKRWELPPKPSECGRGQQRLRKGHKSPRRAADLAVAARGRCAGIVSRSAAFLIDFALVFAIFVLWLLILTQSVQEIRDNDSIDYGKSSAVGVSSYVVLFFFYESLMVAAANRTIGKAVMGLLIVNRQGRAQRCQFGLYRSFLKSIPGLVLGTLAGLFRIDRRSAIDLAVCSTVIYAWDAESFRVREKMLDEGEKLDDVHSEDESSSIHGDS